MPNLFLIFSHKLTPQQKNNAQQKLGVTDFLQLPEDLQKSWSNIPPDANLDLPKHLKPFLTFLENNGKAGDYVLIQGDFGAVFFVVNHCLAKGLIPVYATTERKVVSEVQSDGSVVMKKVFQHVSFRKYQF